MNKQIIMIENPVENDPVVKEGKWIYSRQALPEWRKEEMLKEGVDPPKEFDGYSITKVFKEALNLRTEYSYPLRYFKGWFIIGAVGMLWDGHRIMSLNELSEHWDREKARLEKWDGEGLQYGIDDRWKPYREKLQRGINQAFERCVWTQEEIDKEAAKITDEKVRKNWPDKFIFKRGTIPQLIVERLKKGNAGFSQIQYYIDNNRVSEGCPWISNMTLANILARMRVHGYIKQKERGDEYQLGNIN